jgi:hypothetical protein
MPTFFSDNLGKDGIADVALANPSQLKDASIIGSRMRVKRMEVSFVGASPAPAVNDIVRMGTFKATDRIYEILLNVEAVVTAGATADIGFHDTGVRHNGAVADVNLLGTAVPLSAAVAVGVFGRDIAGAPIGSEAAATLEIADRGRPIWAWLDEGRGDTVYGLTKRDVQVDLTMTLLGTQAVAAGVIQIEVWYVSGD